MRRPGRSPSSRQGRPTHTPTRIPHRQRCSRSSARAASRTSSSSTDSQQRRDQTHWPKCQCLMSKRRQRSRRNIGLSSISYRQTEPRHRRTVNARRAIRYLRSQPSQPLLTQELLPLRGISPRRSGRIHSRSRFRHREPSWNQRTPLPRYRTCWLADIHGLG